LTAGTAEDPKATTTYRVLKAVVIILGILIVLAFSALVVGVAVKVSGRHGGTHPPAPAPQTDATLPLGAKITSTQRLGNRLIIVFHDADGDGVEIVDIDTARPIGVIAPRGASK